MTTPQTSYWNNADLLKFAKVCEDCSKIDKSTQKTNKFSILKCDANIIISAIGKYKHKLSPKDKEFTFNFIKSIQYLEAITPAQMKVLRGIQKKVDPNYLKQPKFFI